jgi:hypothetical protein
MLEHLGAGLKDRLKVIRELRGIHTGKRRGIAVGTAASRLCHFATPFVRGCAGACHPHDDRFVALTEEMGMGVDGWEWCDNKTQDRFADF